MRRRRFEPAGHSETNDQVLCHDDRDAPTDPPAWARVHARRQRTSGAQELTFTEDGAGVRDAAGPIPDDVAPLPVGTMSLEALLERLDDLASASRAP